MQELYSHCRTIQVCFDIQQVRLDTEGLVTKGWIIANVRYSWVEALVPLHTHGIDPLLGYNRIDRAYICGWEPQLRATPKALHDRAFNGIIAPQQTCCLFNLPLVQEATNVRATDHRIILHDGRNDGNPIPKVGRLLLEKGHSTGPIMPETKIVPYHHLVNAQPLT